MDKLHPGWRQKIHFGCGKNKNSGYVLQMITSARHWAWIHDSYNEGSIINKGIAMIKENFDVVLHLNMESTSETHDEAQTAVLQRRIILKD